ncbi:MAG: AI-2E family transporter [Planctomycetes bacterium]|nr:AI-2E family transporter [Planctomycetota bacterium]
MAKPEEAKEESKETVKAHRLHIWQIQAVRDLLFVGAIFGIFWAGYALRAVSIPLLVALMLAYLFEPVVDRLCKHPKIKRPHAVAGILATGGFAVLLAVAIALPLIIVQTKAFVSDIRSGELRSDVAKLGKYVPTTFTTEFQGLLEFLPGDAEPVSQDQNDEIQDSELQPDLSASGNAQPANTITNQQLSKMKDELKSELLAELSPGAAEESSPDILNIAKNSAQAIMGAIGGIVQFGLVAFLIPFYFFFFSLWYPEVVKFGGQLVPEKNRKNTFELVAKMDHVVAGFVRGRIVISLIMGIMLAIGWFICGVPYSIALGLLVGVFCAVPYLGVIGIPLAVGLLVFDKLGVAPEDLGIWLGWWGVFLWPTLVFVIVQLIEGYVLTPMIAGKATNLDPVTIIVAVLAGGSVLGIYGMLLAIPLAACAKILFTEVLLPKIKAWTRGEAADPLPID